MTPRQKEALRWLETVGEASEFVEIGRAHV